MTDSKRQGAVLLTASAVLIALVGAALALGGAYLLSLGGSPYYVIAGAALIASGVLYFRRKRFGERLFAMVLVGTLIWGLVESNANPWALLARTFALAVIGLWLAMPWIRRGLIDAPPKPWRNEPGISALLIMAVLAVQFIRFQDLGDVNASAPEPGFALASAASDPADTDWVHYGNGLDGRRFAALSQINVDNVAGLEVAWTHRSGEGVDRSTNSGSGDTVAARGNRAEATPIKVGNVLYTCGTYADIYAINAVTGKEIWRSPTGVDSSSYLFFVCRGVSYHSQPDAIGPCAARIIAPSPGGFLRAVDAATGAACPDFGKDGRISLLEHMGSVDPKAYLTTSPPLVTGGVAVVGSFVYDSFDADIASGVIKAFDVKTGALRWAWDMGAPDRIGAPAPGETYTRSTANAWGVFSADEELGLVYVPLGNPSPDFYGVNRRPVDEEFGSAIVALNVSDGRPRWSYQTTRHDLFDYDLSAQPVLMDIPGPQGSTPAVLQATKRGDIFVLDRRDGKPIFPIKEVSAPGWGIKGERLSKTQPVSELSFIPPPMTEASMWGATPLDQLLCRIRYKQARYDGMFTPPGLDSTLEYPGETGGIDWGGITIDDERKIVIANITDFPWILRQVPRERVPDADNQLWAQRHTPYVLSNEPFISPLTLPCMQPPWGRMVAYDLKTRKLLWSKIIGSARDNGIFGIPTRLPLLMGLPSLGGSVATSGGVVFMGATLDPYIRAFDIRTGKVLWQARTPAGPQASPMTYTANGRQYVVITAGGHAGMRTVEGDYTIAFALPQANRQARARNQ